MTQKIKHILLLHVFFILIHSNSYANDTIEKTTINSAEIVSQGMQSLVEKSCLDWCFTGICTWIRCYAFVCSFNTSPRYRHNNPDMLVTVFDEVGDDPWVEMNSWSAPIQIGAATSILQQLTAVPVDGGQYTEGSMSQDTSLKYKEANAYGHPMAWLSQYVNGMGLCPSEAEPYQPYFMSGVDSLEWRFGFYEMLNVHYYLPGVRTIGSGGYFQQWGSLYPRTGFVVQKSDVKAGAVVAQRVGNIVTADSGGMHARLQMEGNDYSWTVLPGELRVNDSTSGVWQMNKPKQDTSCYVFGENDLTSEGWDIGRYSDDQSYVFSLWRRYECCESHGRLLRVITMNICMP